MISLISEITDSKGRRAARGWVFFDGDCTVCISLARRFRRTLEKRGFGLAALQDPRVAPLLGLPPDELLHEMRVVTTEDELYGGADAVVFLARQIWWAWPLYLGSKFPGMRHLLRAGYRWFADHRHCASGACERPSGGGGTSAKLARRELTTEHAEDTENGRAGLGSALHTASRRGQRVCVPGETAQPEGRATSARHG
jgi:predicted DCC family thiol-disulfide oxidoreductase YuxK